MPRMKRDLLKAFPGREPVALRARAPGKALRAGLLA